MLLLLGAIVAGVAIGVLMGGSFRNLAEVQFRWWGLAFLAAGLQFVPAPSGDERWVGAALLMASFACLVAFMALNIRLPGLWLVAVGFALNLLVIGLNGSMPVRDSALEAAYAEGYADQRRELVRGDQTKHHLERPEDDLMVLADVIPVGAPVRQVLSVGDIVWLVGTVWVVAGLMRPRTDVVTDVADEGLGSGRQR